MREIPIRPEVIELIAERISTEAQYPLGSVHANASSSARVAARVLCELEGLTVEDRAGRVGRYSTARRRRLVGPWHEVEEQDEPIHDEGLRIENKNDWGGR